LTSISFPTFELQGNLY